MINKKCYKRSVRLYVMHTSIFLDFEALSVTIGRVTYKQQLGHILHNLQVLCQII